MMFEVREGSVPPETLGVQTNAAGGNNENQRSSGDEPVNNNSGLLYLLYTYGDELTEFKEEDYLLFLHLNVNGLGSKKDKAKND